MSYIDLAKRPLLFSIWVNSVTVLGLQMRPARSIQPWLRLPPSGLIRCGKGLTTFVLTEAETCTRYVVPKLCNSGWDNSSHSFAKEHSVAESRIFLIGSKVKRKHKERADFLLQYTRDFKVAVVYAESEDWPARDGPKRAKVYAKILCLKSAFSTNDHPIIEFDYLTGHERVLDDYPPPQELWHRHVRATGLKSEGEKALLERHKELEALMPSALDRVFNGFDLGSSLTLISSPKGRE